MIRSIFIITAILFSTLSFAGDLPDLKLTPGVIRPELTVKQICETKWGEDHRAVTLKMKQQVIIWYHFDSKQCPSGKVEIDHLISRELGGADDVKNLWPECYELGKEGWGAHKKDRLENALHKLVCNGTITLQQAQKEIVTDWIAAYKKYIGSK